MDSYTVRYLAKVFINGCLACVCRYTARTQYLHYCYAIFGGFANPYLLGDNIALCTYACPCLEFVINVPRGELFLFLISILTQIIDGSHNV